MDCVKGDSKGAIDFNFFPGGQIAGPAGALDVVNNGLVEISMVVASVLSDKMPLNGLSDAAGMGNNGG